MAIEGSEDGNREQLLVAIFAAVIGVVPGIVMVVTQIIRNERTVFTLLETGKYAVALDIILLILGGMDVDRLTWDCRWYGEFWNPHHTRCTKGHAGSHRSPIANAPCPNN